MGGFEPAYIREIVTEKNGKIEGGRAFRAATDARTGTGEQYDAEAELARVARDAEAMRPAGVAAASATVAQTD